ncbi:MAG: hypothetical protein R3246_01000 [Acidimicrobiia bacterium]|nr:hypothetical protein [Acidimicrobiia bacterium]
MDFKGHLRLPEDASTGIPVVLRLDDIFVIITSGDEELGAWRADDVEIERIFSNQFAIDLDGEPMVFVAQDALGFAYEGIAAIEDLQSRLSKRSLFRRTKRKERKGRSDEAPPTEEPTAVRDDQAPSTPARRPAADLVSHLDEDATDDSDADEIAPAVEPAAIWTPPAVSAPPVEVEETPFTPPATARRSEPSTEDVRISYPRVDVPAAPAVDSFVPPTEPESEAPATAVETPVQPVAGQQATGADTAEETEAAVEPLVEPESVVESEPVVEHEPVVQHEPEPVVEPELEIEEVDVAATGAAWDDASSTTPPDDEPEIEIEIEDNVAPTASAVETFKHSAPEPDFEPEADVEPEPVLDSDPVVELVIEPEPVVEPEPEPEPVEPESQPVDESQPVAEDDSDQDTEISAGARTEQEPAAEDDAAPEAATARNGHVRRGEKRRLFPFGRGRDKSVPEHEHDYGEPKTIGGLTRQVCEICGHVTFSGHDVYQDW